MKHLLLAFLAIVFVAAATAQTVRIPVQGETTKMKIESNSGLSFTADLNISEFTLTKVETPAGYFTVVDLPKFTKRLMTAGRAFRFSVSSSKFQQLVRLP